MKAEHSTRQTTRLPPKASGQNPVPTTVRLAAQFRVVGGDYALSVKGRRVAPGIYTVRVLADGGEARRRVVVIP